MDSQIPAPVRSAFLSFFCWHVDRMTCASITPAGFLAEKWEGGRGRGEEKWVDIVGREINRHTDTSATFTFAPYVRHVAHLIESCLGYEWGMQHTCEVCERFYLRHVFVSCFTHGWKWMFLLHNFTDVFECMSYTYEPVIRCIVHTKDTRRVG